MTGVGLRVPPGSPPVRPPPSPMGSLVGKLEGMEVADAICNLQYDLIEGAPVSLHSVVASLPISSSVGVQVSSLSFS